VGAADTEELPPLLRPGFHEFQTDGLVYAAFYQANEWLLQEGREPRSHGCPLYCMYNFVRQHKTLRTSPAQAAGIEARLWDMSDVVALIDAREAPAKKRGPYRKAENSN